MPSDDDMTNLSVDELVEQITVDAYGDEGYWSFLQALEDHVRFPIIATLVGIDVTVISVDFDGDERIGLTATVARGEHTSTISVLDLEFLASEVPVAQLAAAYRRWLGLI
jgi:hypothetical protein